VRTALLGGFVYFLAIRLHGEVHTSVTLRGGDESDPTMLMILVVPKHDSPHPHLTLERDQSHGKPGIDRRLGQLGQAQRYFKDHLRRA
jgi:hypothetical protein